MTYGHNTTSELYSVLEVTDVQEESAGICCLHDSDGVWVFYNPHHAIRLMATDGTTMVFGLTQQTRC